MKGQSVVYVDAIAGKTFPAPKEHPVIDQKGLVFVPHIMVVQQGTTVEFLNSDNVHTTFSGLQSAATRKQDTIWARGPRVKSVPSRSIRRASCRCSAMYTRRWRAISDCQPNSLFCRNRRQSGNYKIKDVPDGSYTVVVVA